MSVGITPVPNFHMWFFPDIQTVDGNLEVRIFRLDQDAKDRFYMTYGGGLGNPNGMPLNPYLWENYFPDDCIHLDSTNNSDIINYSGDIDLSTINELAGIRTAKATFDFNDKEGFSGVNGNGNIIFWEECQLFNEGKSLSQHIFNDKSKETSYIIWTTLFDTKHPRSIINYTPDQDQFLKVTFVGDINTNNMSDQPVLIRNESNPSNLLRLAVIKLNCTPCYDRVQNYKMRDLVYNRFQDGNKAITVEDTTGHAFGENRVSFLAGFRVKTEKGQLTTFVENLGLDPKGTGDLTMDHRQNVEPSIVSQIGPGAQAYITTENLSTRHAFEEQHRASPFLTSGSWLFNESGGAIPDATLWNCETSSFRNGWYGVSLGTILRKVASFAGCDPSILATFDKTILGGNAQFNNTNGGYDCKHAVDSLSMEFVTNFNIMFGVDPRGQGIIQTYASDQPNSTATRVTVKFLQDYWRDTFHTSHPSFQDQDQSGLVDGQQVFIENSGAANIDGVWTVTNVTTYVDSAQWQRQDFDLVGSVYSGVDTAISHDTSGKAKSAGTVNILFTSPVTFADSDGFDIFIKDTLWQFIYKLRFPITQSGNFIGMPIMAYTSRWKKGKPLPGHLTAGTEFDNHLIAGVKFGKQPRKISSDCIKISQRGSQAYAICPANGKQTPIEIPALRWRTHQYGTKNAIFPQNIVFDDSDYKNWTNQDDTTYNYGTFGDRDDIFGQFNIPNLENNPLSESKGWLMGAYLYEQYIDAPNSNPRYPSVWDHWCDVNAPFPSGNWSGHYALQTLMWNGDSNVGDTLNPIPAQFNVMYDVIREAALEFLSEKEMYVRDFIGLTYLDDPDDDYEDAWQEGGKLVYYRMGNRIYNQLIGAWTYSEWIASPVDADGNPDYSSLDNAPTVVFYNGAAIGAGGMNSSFTGSNSSTNTTNQWNDTFRVTTRDVKLFSGGVLQKEFTKVAVFETKDAATGNYIAQYGFMPQIEPQSFDTLGMNLLVQFHLKGTEHGNCAIEGLSALPNTPDYWFTALCMTKRQNGSDIDVNYFQQFLQWSEDLGQWLFARPLEVANPNRRIDVHGRFDCTWDGAKFVNFVWKTLTSNDYTFSDDECKSNSDLGITGATRALPTLASNGATVDVIWDTRFKPVSVHSLACFEYARQSDHHIFFNAIDIQMGAIPARNQKCVTNPAKNVNSVNLGLWMNDWAAAVNARHISQCTPTDINNTTARVQFGLWTFEFWGNLSIIGDNASTI